MSKGRDIWSAMGLGQRATRAGEGDRASQALGRRTRRRGRKCSTRFLFFLLFLEYHVVAAPPHCCPSLDMVQRVCTASHATALVSALKIGNQAVHAQCHISVDNTAFARLIVSYRNHPFYSGKSVPDQSLAASLLPWRPHLGDRQVDGRLIAPEWDFQVTRNTLGLHIPHHLRHSSSFPKLTIERRMKSRSGSGKSLTCFVRHSARMGSAQR